MPTVCKLTYFRQIVWNRCLPGGWEQVTIALSATFFSLQKCGPIKAISGIKVVFLFWFWRSIFAVWHLPVISIFRVDQQIHDQIAH